MRLFVCFMAITAMATAQQPGAAPPADAIPPSTSQAQRAASLLDFSSSLEQLSGRVSRGVVQIFSSGYALNDEPEGGTNTAVLTRQRATGSGVILSADGYIVTNNHVVANARHVRVRVPAEMPGRGGLQPGGKILEARIVGVDRDTDLAVLKVEKTGLPNLTLGDSDDLRQGQLVMAFGNPLGFENSVSMGVVSSVDRQLKPDDTTIYIQTDAPINPGNSGGPLVDVNGRVIGINTFILSQSGGSEGLGFAIPSNVVQSVYSQIRAEGHVHRSEIGASVQTITPTLATGLRLPQDWGVVLSDIEPGEPAEQAGLKAGDVVLSLDGRIMRNARQFELHLYRYRMGQKVNLEVLRGTSKMMYEVPVRDQEDDPERFADMVDPVKNLVPKLGILGIAIDQQLVAMLPGLRKPYGVVVAAQGGDSPYTGDSLKLGDVIYSVNTGPVTTVDALRSAIDGLHETDPLVLQVERNGKLLYLTMIIE